MRPSPRHAPIHMRPRKLLLSILLAGLTAMAGCGGGSSSSSSSSASTANGKQPVGALGPERLPLELGPVLAPASSTTPGKTVDGIQCAPIEQLAYHIHAHLQVFVDGKPAQLPAAIGLIGPVPQQSPAGPFYGAQHCYYWLHTHASDGVIHIESPTARIYTLGNFFDEWHQPLSSSQVGPHQGKVTAYVNGKPWSGPPSTIPLTNHSAVQLDVGSPIVPYQAFAFAGSGL